MMIIAIAGAVAVLVVILIVYFKCKAKSTLGQSPDAKSVEVLGDAHDLKSNYRQQIDTKSFNLKNPRFDSADNSPNTLGVTPFEIKEKYKKNLVLPANARMATGRSKTPVTGRIGKRASRFRPTKANVNPDFNLMLPSQVIQVRPKSSEENLRKGTKANIKKKTDSGVAYVDTDKSGLTGQNGSSMNTSNGMPSARTYKKELPKKSENNKKKELIVVNKDVHEVSMVDESNGDSSMSSSLMNSSDESSDSSSDE